VSDATLNDGWYVSREHEMLGPLADAELRQRVERGLVSPHDYVWREGQELWLLVTEVPALKAAIRTSSPAGHEQTRADVRAEHTRRDEANRAARQKGAVGKAGVAPKVSLPKSPRWSAPAGPSSEQGARPAPTSGTASTGNGATAAADLGAQLLKWLQDAVRNPTQLALILVVAGIVFPPLLVPLWLAAWFVWTKLRK
jgi:hypothetical protein